MLYPLLIAAAIFYFAMSHVSYKYFERVKRAYFGDNFKRFKTGEVFEAILWPLTLPAFYKQMHQEIKAVKSGQDWADINIPPECRDSFRTEFMRAQQ